MLKLYITPVIGDGLTMQTIRRPKYSAASFVSSHLWGMIDFGLEPTCIFVAEVTAPEHTTISGQTDVYSFPDDIDVQLGAQNANTLKNYLETRNIPANWAGNTDTYRSVVHVVGGMFQFMQRLNAFSPIPLFGSGITMETRFNQLSPTMQTALIAAANSMGYDTTSISGGLTLRLALKQLADSWTGGTIDVMGYSF